MRIRQNNNCKVLRTVPVMQQKVNKYHLYVFHGVYYVSNF